MLRDDFLHAVDAGVLVGRDERDGRNPLAFAEHLEHDLDIGGHLVGAFLVGLVDDEDVGDLHDAGLHYLHVVAHSRREDEADRVRYLHDVDFGLPDADRLYDDRVEAAGVEYERGLVRAAADAAEISARAHAADEDALLDRVVLHAQAVAENSAASEGARRVYRYYADLLALGLELRDEPVDEGALARAWASGDSDDVGLAGPRIYLFHNFFGLWRFCLHKTDKAADGSRVAVESAS